MSETNKENSIYIKLAAIQQKIKVPRDQNNKFADFKYRSASDILEKVKPLLLEQKSSIVMSDTVQYIGDQYYIEATITFVDLESEMTIPVCASAREEKTRPKMSEGQLTGAASSYARKYALSGLLLLDDEKDPDSQNNTPVAKAVLTKPVNDLRPTRNHVEKLKKLMEALNVQSYENYLFFQDAIGKNKPQVKADFEKAIQFAEDRIGDNQDMLDEQAKKS